MSARDDALIEELRRLRLELHRWIARLSGAPITAGLAARAKAIGRELVEEARIHVAEVRTEAMIDGIADHLDDLRTRDAHLESELGRLAEVSGQLRAERTRVEARLFAERAVVDKMQRLLDPRMRSAEVARAGRGLAKALSHQRPLPARAPRRTAGTRFGYPPENK